MTQNVIDLDALLPADKTVKLGGVEYVVPGDMPLSTFLRMQRVSQLEDADDEGQMVNELTEAAVELFGWKIAEGDQAARSKLRRDIEALGIQAFLGLFSAIYKEEQDEDPTSGTPGSETPPPQEAKDGTLSTNEAEAATPSPSAS